MHQDTKPGVLLQGSIEQVLCLSIRGSKAASVHAERHTKAHVYRQVIKGKGLPLRMRFGTVLTETLPKTKGALQAHQCVKHLLQAVPAAQQRAHRIVLLNRQQAAAPA